MTRRFLTAMAVFPILLLQVSAAEQLLLVHFDWAEPNNQSARGEFDFVNGNLRKIRGKCYLDVLPFFILLFLRRLSLSLSPSSSAFSSPVSGRSLERERDASLCPLFRLFTHCKANLRGFAGWSRAYDAYDRSVLGATRMMERSSSSSSNGGNGSEALGLVLLRTFERRT